MLRDEIRSLVNRGRRLLEGRSQAEVLAAGDGLKTLFEDNLDALEAASFDDADKGEGEGREWVRHSQARMLKVLINRVEIRGQADFPAALWSEYFAVLALQRVRGAFAMDWGSVVGPETHRCEHIDQLLSGGFIYFMDAQEALTIAEMLRTEESVRDAIGEHAEAQLRSLDAQRSARKRRQPLDQLKREMIDFYQANAGKGVAGAVRAFLRTVPNERIKRDCGIRDPDRVLKETLYDFRKGRLDPTDLPATRPPE